MNVPSLPGAPWTWPLNTCLLAMSNDNAKVKGRENVCVVLHSRIMANTRAQFVRSRAMYGDVQRAITSIPHSSYRSHVPSLDLQRFSGVEL